MKNKFFKQFTGAALAAGLLTIMVARIAQPANNTASKNQIALTNVSDISAATLSLQNRLSQFENLTPTEKDQFIEQAKQRRQQIKTQLEEAKNDPAKIAAINNQLSINSVTNNLSPQSKATLQPYLEQSVQLSGTISPAYVEYEGASPEYTYTLTTADSRQTYRVYSTNPLSDEPSTVNITGKALDEVIVTSGTNTNTISSVANADASTTFKSYGTLNTLVVLVPLPGIPMKDLFGTDITEDNVYSKFMTDTASAKKFIESATYYPNGPKASTIVLNRSDVITIPYNKTPTSCDYLNWSNYADGKLSSTQLSHDRIAYVFPRLPTLCINAASKATLNGYGQIKNSRTWFFGNTTTHVLTHELTHNAGAHHAMAMYCGDHQFSSFSDTSCKWAKDQSIVNSEPIEYADMYDNQGGGGKYEDSSKTISKTNAPNPSAVWKKYLGWISSSRTTSIGTSTGSRTVTLLPLDTYASSGYQQIKIAATKFSSNSNFYVEFRRPVGIDNVWPINKYSSGTLLVRLYGDNTYQIPYGGSTMAIPAILDPIAPFNADYFDRGLSNPGTSTDRFTDPINKVIVRLMPGSTSSSAKVCVGVGSITSYCQ